MTVDKSESAFIAPHLEFASPGRTRSFKMLAGTK